MNYLDDPRLFLRIVEAGSLKATAEELETDPATVTRRLSALEARLGVKLLERSRAGSTATEAGRKYYEEMRHIMASVDAVEAEVAGLAHVPRGFVRLSCPVDFGARFVTDWIVKLQHQHEELTVELLLTDQYVDMIGQNIDVVLRIGPLADSSLIARRIGTMPLLIVGSPAYLDERGRPDMAEDLHDHRFVLYNWMQFGRSIVLTSEQGQSAKVSLKSQLSINNVGAIRNAVIGGAGLHIGPLWIFADDLRAGRLEQVVSDWSVQNSPVYALYRPGPYLPAKSRAVLDFMAEQMNGIEGVTT